MLRSRRRANMAPSPCVRLPGRAIGNPPSAGSLERVYSPRADDLRAPSLGLAAAPGS